MVYMRLNRLQMCSSIADPLGNHVTSTSLLLSSAGMSTEPPSSVVLVNYKSTSFYIIFIYSIYMFFTYHINILMYIYLLK